MGLKTRHVVNNVVPDLCILFWGEKKINAKLESVESSIFIYIRVDIDFNLIEDTLTYQVQVEFQEIPKYMYYMLFLSFIF